MRATSLLNLVNLKCILLFFLITVAYFSNGQPGWQDYTKRYSYTILDQKGNPIQFKKSTAYHIMIDSVLFTSRDLPQQELVHANPNKTYKKGYDIQIQINDLSLSIPQKVYTKINRQLEIKIIHENDTLFIYQPSGIGSISIDKNNNDPSRSDLTLSFIPGRYHFPIWAGSYFKHLPKTSKNVNFINADQRNFIIVKSLYDSLLSDSFNRNNALMQRAENSVLSNFMKGHYTLKKSIEPTRFNKTLAPYKNPQWDGQLFQSKDKNRIYGMLSISMSRSKCTSYKNLFATLDLQDNSIELYTPKDNLRLFASSELYVDTFNAILYLPVRVFAEFNEQLSDCEGTKLDQIHYYHSTDEGRSWKLAPNLAKLFSTYNFRELEFIDKHHALGYRIERFEHPEKKTKVVQGTYYLLYDMQVVDSLKTPDDLYYFDNYNNYRFTIKTDTISLGSWSYEKRRDYGNTYYQPYLYKNKSQWEFTVEKRISQPRSDNKKAPSNTIKNYHNFQLHSNRTLHFKRTNSSLTLTEDVTEKISHQGYFIIENGTEIYLINSSTFGHVYFSFNAGKTWYVYPTRLESKQINYADFKFDSKGYITHFMTDWGSDGYKMSKVFHQFKEVKR